MTSYVALLRAVNVGGRNLVSMSDLVEVFRDAGYANARTHGQSGNVLFESEIADRVALESHLEALLEDRLSLSITVVIRSREQLAQIIDSAPPGHGSELLRGDVFFLKHPDTAQTVLEALPSLREGVDSISLGPGVLYFSRVAARASETRLQKVMALPVYRLMTVRTWKVAVRLLELIGDV